MARLKPKSDDGVEIRNRIIAENLAIRTIINEQNSEVIPTTWVPCKPPLLSLRDGNAFSDLFSSLDTLDIYSEEKAKKIMTQYDAGTYVLFKKNDAFYLLAKLGTEVCEFAIVSRKLNSCVTSSYLMEIFFNLQDSNGNLLFEEHGISERSIYSFLKHSAVTERFPTRLKLTQQSLSSLANGSQKEAASLQELTIKELVLNDPSLTFLDKLPEESQDKAWFYWLDLFLAGLSRVSTIQSFISEFLLSSQQIKLYCREHYSTEAIQKNLDTLHLLSENGNSKAAIILAAISYRGLCAESHRPSTNFDARYHFLNVVQIEIPILFRNLKIFKEITQNPLHVPEEAVRGLLLLRYFEHKQDNESAALQLKNLDLPYLMRLDNDFISDYEIKSSIMCDEFQGVQKFLKVENLFHELLNLKRLYLAAYLKNKLPEEQLLAKDKKGRTLLHLVIDYFLEVSTCGLALNMEIFQFVSNLSPELLSEVDSDGNTVYDKFEQLKLKFSESTYNRHVVEEIGETITMYPIHRGIKP